LCGCLAIDLDQAIKTKIYDGEEDELKISGHIMVSHQIRIPVTSIQMLVF